MPPQNLTFRPRLGTAVFAVVCLAFPLCAQDTKPTPTEKTTSAAQTPAQIELLETAIRFEPNGDSRKEIHARVHINNELGARQFALLSFDYHRAFQKIEIPLLRITHVSGGTADILPSATIDQPNPAVLNAPAYQDIRVKSVRLLGLTPGDSLEYRVVTTVTQHPLAPDFWLEHSFNHDGVVSQELFEVSVPSSRKVQLYASPSAPAKTSDESSDPPNPRITYRWRYSSEAKPEHSRETTANEPEIVLTTFESWQQLANQLAKSFHTSAHPDPAIFAKASALVRAADPDFEKHYHRGPELEAIYDFVSQKIRTIDLPLGSTGFRTRPPEDILKSGYGTPEDKVLLFTALASTMVTLPSPGLISSALPKETAGLARPSVFDHVLTEVGVPLGVSNVSWWLDLSTEVAPYGMIPSQFRGKRALRIEADKQDSWVTVQPALPFAAKQKVDITATLSADGTLNAKVKYTMRGDNELLLRVAFHQSAREKWNEVAQLLALSDGFRGKIVAAHASDPSATKQPFVVEYEISQPKFVDWTKKPIRIPALLPLLGLPEPPDKSTPNATPSIDLGTPLDVQTQVTLQLPAGTGAEAPSGTSVDRDYAMFTSTYNVLRGSISASRHIHFLLRQLPSARLADYNAFLHAVQTDQAQFFTLDPASDAATPPKAQPTRAASTPHP